MELKEETICGKNVPVQVANLQNTPRGNIRVDLNKAVLAAKSDLPLFVEINTEKINFNRLIAFPEAFLRIPCVVLRNKEGKVALIINPIHQFWQQCSRRQQDWISTFNATIIPP